MIDFKKLPNALKKTITVFSGIALLLSPMQLSAQGMPEPMAVLPQIDEYGVNIAARQVQHSGLAGVSIGEPGTGGLAFSWSFYEDGWRHSAMGSISSSGNTYTVTVGGSSASFTKSGSTYTSDQGDGKTLTYAYLAQGNPAGYYYTYTDRNGVKYRFSEAWADYFDDVNEAMLDQITFPDKVKYNINYVDDISATAARVQSISSSLKYRIHLEYANNGDPETPSEFVDWKTIVKATAYNNDIDPCWIFKDVCTFNEDWPHVIYTGSEFRVDTAKNALGQTTTFSHNGSDQLTGIDSPDSGSANDITYAYSSGKVSSVTTNGSMWSYSVSGNEVTVSGPSSTERIYVLDGTTDRILSVEDGENQKTEYTYDTTYEERIKTVKSPRGNVMTYDYDGRGNVIETRLSPHTGTASDIVTSATYTSGCGSPARCNKPTSTTDALNNVTNYTYDASHGGLLTVRYPAVDGIRQKITYTYSQTHTGAPLIWRPTKVTTCPTQETCSGSAAESVTEFVYSGDHVRLDSVTRKNGTGSLSATTTIDYFDTGDISTINGPLTGDDDKVFYHYDELRRQIGSIGPDPDGIGGPLLRRAQLAEFTSWGGVSETSVGTVTGTEKSHLSNISKLSTTEFDYDTHLRQIKAIQKAGSTTTAVTQTSYDAVGRVECRALRQVLSGYSSDACTPGAGSTAFGPNRVTKYEYDTASRITKVRTGYQIEQQITEYTYLKGNLLKTVEDGVGNITTYQYDTFARRYRTDFPDASYERLTFDAGSRVTKRKLRDGAEIDYAYDDRHRLTSVTPPSGTSDLAYDYDVMGRMTEADMPGDYTLDYAWDALGRLTDTTFDTHGDVSYQYDAAGRRTRMTWPDNFYVTYDYDVVGALTEILEYGTTSLAEFEYDNLGRRTKIIRGNGTETHYAFDTENFLEEIDHQRTNQTSEQTFNFEWSPAGQIVTRDSSNSAYDYDELSNITIHSLIQSVNELECFGSSSSSCTGNTDVTHDARGNITDIGTDTFSYNAYNQMTSASTIFGGVDMDYDPAGRLRTVEDTSTSIQREFIYDSAEVIVELNGSGVVSTRYVRGPGADEVLVEYAGSGTGSKTWLHHDERGSVIAGSNSSGTFTFVNTYDEYGNPGISNTGAFQYTGQMWLPEIGMYHYKARIYNPEHGRFMQTDPIGFAAGLNLYGYVEGDPVNFSDPSGLMGISVEDPNLDCPIGKRNCNSDDPFPYPFKHYGEENENGEEVDEILVIGERLKYLLDGAAANCQILCQNTIYLSIDITSVLLAAFDIANSPVSPTPDASLAIPSLFALKLSLQQQFRAFTRANFRANLGRATGGIPRGADAHHIFPIKFEERFRNLGINIHDPRYGAWWSRGPHRSSASAYNNAWSDFYRTNPNATKDEVLQFGRDIASRYGLRTGF